MNIQKNVGQTDKIVRLVLGVVLLAMIFVVEGNARWLGLIGIVPIVTALAGVLPGLYAAGREDEIVRKLLRWRLRRQKRRRSAVISVAGLIAGVDGKCRCGWSGSDPLYIRYHDTEWGTAVA
jgi:hypothetical protein